MSTLINVVVDGIWREGRHNLSIRLMAPDNHPLPEWTPGAHIDVHLQQGLIRQYSLTGSPAERHYYHICVARDTASRGGSRYIHETLRPGMQLAVSAPRNCFPLTAAGRIILIAAGIGITPLYAMAEMLEAAGLPFVLHYYSKQHGDAAFAADLTHKFRHGVCHLWYSNEGVTPRQHLPAEVMHYSAGTQLYLCGPLAFMTHMQQQAEDYGWPSDQIHSEKFKTAALMPAAEQGAAFTITLARSGRSWLVPPDRSIAAVLLEQGVEIPLSCEMGMCGACLTSVVEGEPDHRDTVQSAGEKQAQCQSVALCCSRSLTKNLTIDL